MIRVLVSGVSWYRTAGNDTYVLPSETAIGLPRLIDAVATGRIAHLLLPQGTLDLPRRALPITPVPVDQVFPLGAAAVEWRPDPDRWQVGTGVPILSQHWYRLFRERRAFEPWGGDEDVGAFLDLRDRLGPRATFREAHDRKHIGFKYPQLVDPRLCYRLGPGYQQLPDQPEYAPVVAVQEGLRLAALDGEAVILFGPGEFGWVVRAFASAGDAGLGKIADSATPRDLAELEGFIAQLGAYWRLEPNRREANLVLPGRS